MTNTNSIQTDHCNENHRILKSGNLQKISSNQNTLIIYENCKSTKIKKIPIVCLGGPFSAPFIFLFIVIPTDSYHSKVHFGRSQFYSFLRASFKCPSSLSFAPSLYDGSVRSSPVSTMITLSWNMRKNICCICSCLIVQQLSVTVGIKGKSVGQ